MSLRGAHINQYSVTDSSSFQPFSVLVVGAGPDALRALSDAATEQGVRLTSEATEAAALDYAGAHAVALVVIDLTRLPVDPAAFGAHLRALQQTATPLVFLVGVDTPRAQIDAGYALGAVDFLSLPLLDTLVRARLEMAALHWQTVQLGDRVRGEQLNLNRDNFSQLLASSSEGIYGMGADGSCSFINPAGAAMLGYEPAELQGRKLHALIHHKYADGAPYPLAQCKLAQAARAGASIRVDDEVFWHKEGYAVPVAYSVAPILVEGVPSGAVITFTDSTERRANEVRLKASEQRVRLATDAAELGMWRWQPEDDQIVWENPRMFDIFRMPYDVAPINAVHFAAKFAHPADSADFNEAVTLTLSTGARFHFEGRFMPGDGSAYRWIEFTGLLQPQEDGTPPQMIGTAHDITARKRTEEDLRALAAELSESNRRKGEFLATLAHELRNPLAPIRTGLAVLGLGGDKPEAVARIRAMMERQVSHMVHLVDDLLDVARISSGKVDLKIARVDVKGVIASAVETSQPLIDAARHQLTVELSPMPLWLDADLTRLAQVVGNLLTNAAKYTLPGGKIQLRVSRDERYVLIAVTDSGMGIPRAELPTVFDMFTQVSTHSRQAQGGLGIGLSLVRHLVELHGGSVAVHSEGEGMGSTFEVRLPLADTGERRKYVRPLHVPDPMAHAGLNVLIADDNEDAAEALSEFLRIAGHHVSTVNNGHDALRTGLSARPDAILLDIGMPGLNGYEVAKALRAAPGMADTVLIALTGWGTDDDRSRASAAGFDHHLTKPTSAADIVKVLETARKREG
jgi:PAS domain S-box-containing protein